MARKIKTGKACDVCHSCMRGERNLCIGKSHEHKRTRVREYLSQEISNLSDDGFNPDTVVYF